MKHFTQNLRWLFMSLLLVVGVGSAWGSTTVSMTSFSTISGLVDNDANISYEAAKGTAATAPAVNNNEIRVYQNGGTFTVTANNGVKINSVTLGSSMGTTVTYSIDGGTASSDQSITANSTITVNGLDCSTVLFTCTGTSKTTRLYVNHLSVTYSSGDVTPTVATPTFSPESGAVAEGTEVTISCSTSGATIHYTTDGSTPTSNSTTYSAPIVINSDQTIKAIGTMFGYDDSEVAEASYTILAPVSGYVIDFESSLDAYNNWTFENIGRHNSGINAHGGNYWGANVNTSNNSVYTANIQTTNKVARPGTFTCYVSKESNNTASSTWYVQVSTDGSTWEDVTTQSATSMSKGEWVEISANLTSYTNVYVRLYYNGTNAVRTVDDITLTESSSTDPVNPTFEWSSATATAVLGTTPTLPTLNNNSDGTVTYTSSNTSVATIASDGTVSILAAGETTITASVTATSNYNAATATYTLKVTSAATTSGDYEKVTSTADLTDGKYLIVYEDGSVAFNGGLNTLDAVSNNISVTISDNKIESNATVDAAVFTIEAVDGEYSIHSVSGYYIGNTGDSNGLNTNESIVYTNSITIDEDGNAQILASGGSYLRYNSTSNQARFRYYKSSSYTGQQAIQLYKKTNSSVSVDVEEMSMNAKGWTTYVFDHDIDAYQTTQNYVSGDEETLKIYKVTEFDHEMCVLQQLGMNTDGSSDSERYIPAKTPVVINGPAREKIEFVLYSSPEMLPTVKNNLLIGSLSPNLAVAPAGSGIRYFVLQWNNETNAPWFNKVSEGRSVPDHKAYLNGTDQVEAVSTTQSVKSQGIYVIGGEQEEATGIVNVESENVELSGEWFTLQGVRIDRPTVRGIYINNGKKVLIK